MVDRSYIRIGTLLCMFLGGPIIDVFTSLLGGLINAQSAMALRLVALVAGCVILAFGMTNVIKFDAGTGPNDLVTVVISDNSAKESSPPASRGCEARAQQNNAELAGIPSC